MTMFNKKISLMLLLCAIFATQNVYSNEKASISKIRFSGNSESLRVIMDINNLTKHEISAYNNPSRIAVDLFNVKFSDDFSFPEPIGIIDAIRYAKFNSETSRIVFDLNGSPNIKNVRVLKPSAGSIRRLSFDIISDEKNIEIKKKNSKKNYNLRKTIIIDPGHGGKDPGTSFPKVVSEKDIVLRFSRILMKHLSRNNNYRIFLTREDDRFVSLSDRVNFAKSKNADLFISIHADASSSSSTKGFSVYTLSDKGLDKEAEKLAAIENSYAMANSRYNSNYLRNARNPSDFVNYQRKLKNNRFKSTKFASTLTSRVKSKTSLLNNPLRSAGFAVLKSDEFPSVLVELGFVTNEFDRKNLRSGNWLQTISSQFVSAINEYFK
jgi:N-acetylmuramoyl-L-alanine amidase